MAKPHSKSKKAAGKGAKRATGTRKEVATREDVIAAEHRPPISKKARPVHPTHDAVAKVATELKPTERPEELETRAAGQAGSLQGLSNLPDADSEAVDELLEEGNAFEAGIVQGVEAASNAEAGELKTHEVPEDDVPQEYLEDDDQKPRPR